MIRVSLFIAANLLIVVILGFLLKLLGLENNINIFSMFIMIMFGFIGSIISILFSKIITLNSINGKLIKHPMNKTEIWIINTIKNISKKNNIKIPDVIIYKANNINAFATGACSNNSLIGLSSSLLKYMEKNEIEAVIAHEISHITNGDMVTMGLLQGLMNTFILFFSQIITSLIYNQEEKNNHKNNFFQNTQTIIFTSLEILLGSLSNIIIMGFSRYREFRADAGAAKFVGVNNMIAALNKLKISTESIDNNNMTTFYINNNKFNIFSNIFNSHPSLDERIKALKNLKKK
ncbi:MAG: protease HtpX [Enterobacteriaceae bacterium PSmelAO1]|nr:MAG: protease HtpX [Enterobacteriaceae bacterium PSmelAO1]